MRDAIYQAFGAMSRSCSQQRTGCLAERNEESRSVYVHRSHKILDDHFVTKNRGQNGTAMCRLQAIFIAGHFNTISLLTQATETLAYKYRFRKRNSTIGWLIVEQVSICFYACGSIYYYFLRFGVRIHLKI